MPIFLKDRYTLFSDMYRDCKALGIKDARPLILNHKVSIVDFDKPVEDESAPAVDEIWTPEEDSDEEDLVGLYVQQYEEVYKSPKKAELELMYRNGDIPENRFEYIMLTYSQLKDARKDKTRLDFLTSLCEKRRVLFVFDEAHKSSSVTAGKISIITQSINSILEANRQTQCVFLSATFAKRPECLITFMRQTVLSSLATNETLQLAFANGGVPMQEYVASTLAKEGQMIRREHSGEGIPEPSYTYLDDKLAVHSELFDKVMYWFRELVNLSDMVKSLLSEASLMEVEVFRAYPTRSQLFYINKILLLSLKAQDVAEAAVREVQRGRSVVIGMSDTLECVLRDSVDPETGGCSRGDFSTILLRLLDKTLSNPKLPAIKIYDLDFSCVSDPTDLFAKMDEIRAYEQQIRTGIKEEIFHLPMSPIDVIRQLITQESFTDGKGINRNIRFEECTGRARQLEYLSPEGDDEFVNVTIIPRKKRHSNQIYNDFQNNKLDVILINACGAIGASAHAVATVEVDKEEVRQRKMLIVQNDLDVNIDLQKRGRINRTGQVKELPPLYEYIITGIPSEKRLNMMLRAKLRSLSANTAANQDQDRKQADFIDITNKYGNLITQEFLAGNPELAFVLGLGKSTTATQLLARIAMLSVEAQQDIIDEVFSAYQNLEQELRRINQWDLEREHRDFEAKFVREELFTSPVDDAVLGGASMLST
ncbi:MAG: strawberry notch C-terminal domain-containing protein, partial [Muribaculaceae bacterium]|nr:strawberry notch C-terminal domain-containing protein [Muribaculaceae bacterium]